MERKYDRRVVDYWRSPITKIRMKLWADERIDSKEMELKKTIAFYWGTSF